MSSYVANSLFKQTHEASAFALHNQGYGSNPGLSASAYCGYGGHDHHGSFASPPSSSSLVTGEMNVGLRGDQTPPPESSTGDPTQRRPMNDQTSGQGSLNLGLYRRKPETDSDLSEMHVGKTQTGEINIGTWQPVQPVRQANHSNHPQTSEQQPEIYPWMTKLHMGHGHATYSRGTKDISVTLSTSCSCRYNTKTL
ncbi:homeobox protein Hox-C5 isoform X2 [Esox lucius]|uniref:homeobox protein Hox-C5 isoform X2 n=1 Tax=Esox lucius TaxID=8010 RepID=UPI0005775D19|nr:homeobox protein Hox-C5 isoform X2 [Esox lucius]